MKKWYIISVVLITCRLMNAQTGIPEPGLSTCDNLIQTFMSTYGIPGMGIAIAKDGKLVYHRAFGTADLGSNETLYPYHLFRVASNSKPITSVAIMKLMDDGQLSMSDKVFGPEGILKDHSFLSTATITDTRIYDITIQNLLEHSAGWDRSTNCYPNPTTPYPGFYTGCDPLIAPLHVAHANGTNNPIEDEDNIYFLLEKGLDFSPNTQFAYSNVGFLILGEVIETLTGMNYHEYIQSQIFDPIFSYDMYRAKNLLTEKLEREVEYHGDGMTSLDCYGNNTVVPWEYGGINIESFDAASGWVASTRDYVRFLTAVDGFATVPDILSSNAVNIMSTPSANNSFYAKGWSVNGANNWWHNGSLDGNATIIVRTSGGFTWVVFLNKRVIGTNANSFWSDLDGLPWNCIGNATSYPDHDLFATPTLATTEVHFDAIDNASCQVNWTNGDGTHRLLVGKAGSPVDRFPVDGISYTADANFGSGSELGDGNFILFDGTGSETTLTNLVNGTVYYFRVFEYNQNATTGNHKLYLLPRSESIPYYHGCHNTLHLPVVSQNVSRASVAITSDAMLEQFNTTFQAGQYVELWPGFTTEPGFAFEVSIEDCSE